VDGTRTTLEAALEYCRRGWSIIPMAMDTKRPAVRWKRYQTDRARENTVRRWFSNGEQGIAVVFGGVSGNLISRDFDTMQAYEQWAADHPDLATTLPTVATSRGRHVYATATEKHIADFRYCTGRPEGTGAIVVDAGELRCGVGCYSVLPPSVHPSGTVYRWEIPLPDRPLPEIDVFEAGFYQPPLAASEPCNREHREHGEYRGVQRQRKSTEAIRGVCDSKQIRKNPTGQESTPAKDADPHDGSEAIQLAIVDSVPEGPGRRHRQVFELARGLKAVPELADADVGELKPYVRQWHKLSIDHIATKPFTETWIDFLKAWPRIRYPKGEDPMTAIFERATQQSLPEVAEDYDQDELRLLVALCRELQRSAGGGPFYLSCRTAGRLLGVDYSTANRWLFLMANDGILEVTEPGDRAKRKAARYRYLGEL